VALNRPLNLSCPLSMPICTLGIGAISVISWRSSPAI
jgi:hypothetical protein